MKLEMGTCWKCRQRPATTYWVGDNSVLGFIHGGGQPWCELCCLKAQLYHAIQSIASIPELRARIVKLEQSTENGIDSKPTET